MRKIIAAIYLLLYIQMIAIAQSIDKDDAKLWEDADIDFEIGDFRSALDVYSGLIEKYPEETSLNYKVGVCHYYLRSPDEAIPYLEKAHENGEREAAFYLARVYHLEGKLNEEMELYQVYKNYEGEKEKEMELVNRLIDQAKLAKEMIDHPVHVDILNIGPPVNTEFHEYVPLTYGFEDRLYFTSRRPGSTGGLTDHRGEFFEDVYVSKKENGYWQEPEKLDDKINTSTHDACVGISADGQILYIFRTSEDMLTGDLYQSEMTEDGWGKLKKLGSDINSEAIETSASISSDDRMLYFSSNREGGYGGMDIYRVVKLPTGEWSKALNLGPTINTAYNEDSPFIHADNKTLYFSSDGHRGMGGYDIFNSELRADGMWSEPKNLGYPINTLAHDLNFVMSSDKQTGYYASMNRNGMGGQDIYNIKFKLEAKILSVVKGGVESEDTSHIPIEASITLINSETKTIQGIYKSNAKTGQFIMVVTPESTYQVIVEADGYHTFSNELYFDTNIGFGSKIEEFKLIPIEVVTND